MKSKIPSFFLIAILLGLSLSACAAEATPAPLPTETPAPTVTASRTPTSTLTLTPSPTPEPPWYQQVDESYTSMEFRYGLVENPEARRYVSLQDALDGSGNFDHLAILPAYVAIVDEASRDGRTFYQFNYGWMDASEVQVLTPSSFRGLLLTRDVDFRFGWVLAETESVNAAGMPIRSYQRYDVVHEVPSAAENPGYVAVGADEWLPEEAVALTSPQVPEDAGAGTCRFLYVDLAEQTLRVYDACKLVFATLVSTGKQPGWTFAGRFSLQTKFPYIQLTAPAYSTSVYYQEAVPNFMTYYGNLGFHGAYWHDDFGTPVSHGCVNLSPADAKWLYEWSWLGERVIISAGE